MDVLSVGGKDYVKASVIARDLGYTADYVGQLCRSRKVDAKLVGRSWYVDRASINDHRSSRYRSTQTKSKESLKETLEVVHATDRGTTVPVHVAVVSKPLRPKAPAYISYSNDTADLIPSPSKSSHIPVNLADAQEVSITSTDAQYVFEAPSLPTIKFKGKLTLSNIEETVAGEADENTRIIHPKWVFGKGEKKAKNLASSPVALHLLKTKSKGVHIHHAKLVAPTSVKESKQVASSAPETPVVKVAVEEIQTNRVSKLLLFATTTVSLCLALFFIGTESQVTVVGETISTSYSFAFDNLSASVYQVADNLQSALYLVEFSTNFLIF